MCYTKDKNAIYNYKAMWTQSEGIKKLQQKVKASQFLIILAPTIITSVASILISGIQLRNIESIKRSGDFATPLMVMEAKADCIRKAEDDLHHHEDWESGQLERLNNQVNKIYGFLIKE